MQRLDKMGNEQFVFGALMVVANKLDTLLDRELNVFDMTSKQWFLLITIDSLFEKPPTIKEVAKAMGSSHQNVKQVALKLKTKGFLNMEKDPKDARATRLQHTEKSYEFWEKTQQKGVDFINKLFKNISEDEISAARVVIQKIWANLDEMESTNEG